MLEDSDQIFLKKNQVKRSIELQRKREEKRGT